MTVHFVLTWNYLLYPLAAIGVCAIVFVVWCCRQSW